MRLGLLLTSTEAGSLDAQFRRHLAMVAAAERYGFATIVASQHFASYPYAYFHPVTLLSRLAAETSLRLATGVLLLPLLRTIEVAESIATLDVLSGGRAVLGAGVGYRPEEFEAFGVPRAERGARFDESLRLILQLWGSDGPVDFAGRFHTLTQVRVTTRPQQRPHPPVWVGGMADAAVRRAATLGDAWYVNPNASHETLRRQLDLYRRTLAEQGRSFPQILPVRREVFVYSDGESRARADEVIRQRYDVYAQWNVQGDLPEADARAHAVVRSGQSHDSAYDNRFIVGTPRECARLLSDLERVVGSDVEVICRLDWPSMTEAEVLEQIRLMGAEVAPLLDGKSPSAL